MTETKNKCLAEIYEGNGQLEYENLCVFKLTDKVLYVSLFKFHQCVVCKLVCDLCLRILLVKVACVRFNGTKCPLLTSFFGPSGLRVLSWN